MENIKRNLANIITLIRTILVFIVVAILFYGRQSDAASIIAFFLTIVVIWMDGIDGYVARKFNISSKMGAVIDIIGDRIVENVYWVAFVALGWIPVWIPLVVLTRGIVVDGIRSVALEQGMTAFGKTTMMKTPIGKFLVASNFSRFSYAAFKAIAFSLMILVFMPGWQLDTLKSTATFIAYASVYITVFLCIVRGLPVVIESKYLFNDSALANKNADRSQVQCTEQTREIKA